MISDLIHVQLYIDHDDNCMIKGTLKYKPLIICVLVLHWQHDRPLEGKFKQIGYSPAPGLTEGEWGFSKGIIHLKTFYKTSN